MTFRSVRFVRGIHIPGHGAVDSLRAPTLLEYDSMTASLMVASSILIPWHNVASVELEEEADVKPAAPPLDEFIGPPRRRGRPPKIQTQT